MGQEPAHEPAENAGGKGTTRCASGTFSPVVLPQSTPARRLPVDDGIGWWSFAGRLHPALSNPVNASVELCGLRVNGEPVLVAVPAHWTLLELLRYTLGLTGTKQGCDKGDCGACTVELNGKAVLSCLMLALEARGGDVRTVEGLGKGAELHPLQDAFDRHNAAQCGFCTPGMLMSSAVLLDSLAAEGATTVSRETVAHALSGNLCRCTGYVKILDAVADAAPLVLLAPKGHRTP